jgi:Cof subfamily protein (haloacid dehalogenase superfamily)
MKGHMVNKSAFPDKPPRLLVTDIDGTLIHGTEDPSPQLIKAIHAARARGLRFTLASGRNGSEVQWFQDQLGLEGIYISLGGAYVRDSSTSEILLDERLPSNLTGALLHIAKSNHMRALLEYPHDFVYIGDPDYLPEMKQQVRATEIRQSGWPDTDLYPPPGKIIFISDEDGLKTVEKILTQYHAKIEHSRSRDLFLDITKRGVNKGQAVQLLADRYGIHLDQIVAIGDGWNDKSMFDVAGFAIAMGTGKEQLRQFADLVTPPSLNTGFEWALERVVSWMT